MKHLSRFLLFARTLLSSGLNEYRITVRVKWRVLPSILRAIFERHEGSRGPGSLWWRRMRGCQRCPLYDRHRRACGHLWQEYQRGGVLKVLGCGCFLPLKASIGDARCWLHEETGGMNGVDWSAPPIRSTSVTLTLKSKSNGQSF